MMNLWIVSYKRERKQAMRIVRRLYDARYFLTLWQVKVCTTCRLLDSSRYLAGTDDTCVLRQV